MLGNIKIVAIIVIYEAALKHTALGDDGRQLTAVNIVGYVITIAAGLVYTLIGLHERGKLEFLQRQLITCRDVLQSLLPWTAHGTQEPPRKIRLGFGCC